jgi:hypothetical protein
MKKIAERGATIDEENRKLRRWRVEMDARSAAGK